VSSVLLPYPLRWSLVAGALEEIEDANALAGADLDCHSGCHRRGCCDARPGR
jgi:hypothetical protein